MSTNLSNQIDKEVDVSSQNICIQCNKIKQNTVQGNLEKLFSEVAIEHLFSAE